MATLAELQAEISRRQQPGGVTQQDIQAEIARRQQPQAAPAQIPAQSTAIPGQVSPQQIPQPAAQPQVEPEQMPQQPVLAGERFGPGAVRPELPEQIPQVQPEPIQAGEFQQIQAAEPEGVFGSLLAGARKGALNIGTGILTGVGEIRKALGDEDAEKFLNNLEILQGVEKKQFELATAEQPVAGFVGEVAGEIAALPLPGGVGGTLARRVATTGTVGAVAGGISAAGRGEDVIEGALLGAGFGAGFQGLTEGGKALARKLLNARGGQFVSDDVRELVETSQREGIDLFADDAAASPLLSKLGILAEDVPVIGTRGGRITQVGQQQKAAERLLENLSGDLQDFTIEAQKGLQRQLKKVKRSAGLQFNEVATIMNPLGNIPRNNFLSRIDQEIQEELAKGTRSNQNIIDILESFKGSPDGNFSRIREQRSDLGDEISAFYKGDNKSIGGKGADKLQRVKNALEEDIEEFVEQSGSREGINKFRRANDFVVRKLIPFKETQLKDLTRTPEPEKIIAFLRGSGGRQSRANILFNSMDTRGRQAIKSALVSDAFEKATTGRQVFSANIFASEMEKVQNATNTFFRGSDRDQLNGLVKLMRATGRAGQVAEQPPTGARLLIPGVGVAAVTNLGTTIAGVGGFGVATRLLFQTKTGRNLLLGLNRTTPDTKRFETLIQRTNDAITRASIDEAKQ